MNYSTPATTEEQLTQVDSNDRPVGSVTHSEAHAQDNSRIPSGGRVIHREVYLLLYNTKGQVLLTRRSKLKKHHPGYWVESAAGHVRFDEDPLDAVIRETREELGFKIVPVFLYKEFDQKTSEARFRYFYYAPFPSNQNITLNQKEVDACEWVDFPEVEEFFKTHNPDPSLLSGVVKAVNKLRSAFDASVS